MHVTVEGLVDLTQLTWLQYHSTLAVHHRNRLALLPVPQLMTYANLHFHQVTSFEQVEIKPLTHHQSESQIVRAINVARNALNKANKGVHMDRVHDNLSEQDDSKSSTMGSSSSSSSLLDPQSVSSGSSKSGSVAVMEGSASVSAPAPAPASASASATPLPAPASASQSLAGPTLVEAGDGDNSLIAPPSVEIPALALAKEDRASSSSPSSSVVGESKNSVDVNATSGASAQSNGDKEVDNTPLNGQLSSSNSAETIGQGSGDSDVDNEVEIPAVSPGYFDNDIDGQADSPILTARPPSPSGDKHSTMNQLHPPSRVHVLDASLNRIRRLTELDHISQWNVRSILFMNLSGNLLVSLDGIECCKNLVALDCSDNILTLMHSLRGCVKLKRLRINGNRLVNVSLSLEEVPREAEAATLAEPKSSQSAPPSDFPELDYFDFSNNKMDSAHGLRGLSEYGKSLVHLEMRNCNLLPIAFADLEGLTHLESLHADNNLFDSLIPMLPNLRAMTKLRHLSLLGNPVAAGATAETAATATAAAMAAAADDRIKAEAKSNSAEEEEIAGAPPKTKSSKSTLAADILNSFGLNLKTTKANEAALLSQQQQQQQASASLYTITILDNVPRLKTFDHLAVSSTLYVDLDRLKAQILGEEVLFEISTRYSREITATMRVHENLVNKHRNDEELVEQAVKTKTARLEQEMEEVMQFGREQMEKLRPKYRVADGGYRETDPKDVLESIITMRERISTPFK